MLCVHEIQLSIGTAEPIMFDMFAFEYVVTWDLPIVS